MTDAIKRAEKLKNKLKIYRRVLEAMEIDPAFAEAQKLAETAQADFIAKHNVRFTGEDDGKRITSVAEVLFVRFGQGDDAAWLAFAVYDGGWAGTVRIFTKDTANMGWLEAYVKESLSGNR